ncbi:MAG: hypothetical protein ACXW3Z_04140, partial [Limisphaerales bacterium]
RWDYKHQVLAGEFVPNWRVLLWVKMIEVICQARPKAVWRLLAHRDGRFRAGMRWYSSIGRRVWIYEIWQWLFHDRRKQSGLTLAEFLRGAWDAPGEEEFGRNVFPAIEQNDSPTYGVVRPAVLPANASFGTKLSRHEF